MGVDLHTHSWLYYSCGFYWEWSSNIWRHRKWKSGQRAKSLSKINRKIKIKHIFFTSWRQNMGQKWSQDGGLWDDLKMKGVPGECNQSFKLDTVSAALSLTHKYKFRPRDSDFSRQFRLQQMNGEWGWIHRMGINFYWFILKQPEWGWIKDE